MQCQSCLQISRMKNICNAKWRGVSSSPTLWCPTLWWGFLFGVLNHSFCGFQIEIKIRLYIFVHIFMYIYDFFDNRFNLLFSTFFYSDGNSSIHSRSSELASFSGRKVIRHTQHMQKLKRRYFFRVVDRHFCFSWGGVGA